MVSPPFLVNPGEEVGPFESLAHHLPGLFVAAEGFTCVFSYPDNRSPDWDIYSVGSGNPWTASLLCVASDVSLELSYLLLILLSCHAVSLLFCFCVFAVL